MRINIKQKDKQLLRRRNDNLKKKKTILYIVYIVFIHCYINAIDYLFE